MRKQRPNSNKDKNNTDQKLLAVAVDDDDDDLLTERIQILQKTTEKHCSTVHVCIEMVKRRNWSEKDEN